MAEWTLTASQLSTLYNTSTAKVDIVLEADGTNIIEEQSQAAQATLLINYGGGKQDVFNRNLIHIKRNGVVCSIYNVPGPNAMDSGNIRITNTSGAKGTLTGTLRDKNGDPIFTNQPLIDKEIEPNETVYITTDPAITNGIQLNMIDKDQTWKDKHGTESWNGRAILTINSNLNSLEIYGLVRNKAGGPLTNMSVGATGNGCD
jgi:hypothetical protein